MRVAAFVTAFWLGQLAGAVAFGCAAVVAPVPPPHVEPVDASDCERAGARLEQLGCRTPAGVPLWRTPGGSPFSEACERAASDGRDWRADCLATIESCAEINDASRGVICRE